MTTEQFAEKQAAISNEELMELVDKQIINLASTGGKSHTMTVPPQVTDTDMIFCELLNRFKKVLDLLKEAADLVGNPLTNISGSTDIACMQWQEKYKQLKKEAHQEITFSKATPENYDGEKTFYYTQDEVGLMSNT